jgi:hypothetical protein
VIYVLLGGRLKGEAIASMTNGFAVGGWPVLLGSVLAVAGFGVLFQYLLLTAFNPRRAV